MNYVEAIKRLKDGEAIKIPSWLGYIERRDTGYKGVFSETTTYYKEEVVSFRGKYYICEDACFIGDFEQGLADGSWALVCDKPHELVIHERSTINNYWYSCKANIRDKSVTYGSWCLDGVEGSPLYVDEELNTAILMGDWVFGSAAEFENIRTDNNRRW